MIQRQYHYLIAGLPELSLNDLKNRSTVPSFRLLLEKELHSNDFEQVKLVFLKDDNTNLIRFLQNKEAIPESAGNFTSEDFREQISTFSAILPGSDILPAYMVNMLKDRRNDESPFEPVLYSHILADGYFSYIMDNGSPFLKLWTKFEYNVSNLLTFKQSRKYGLDEGMFITGDNLMTSHLKQHVSKSLVRDTEFDLYDEIIEVSEIPSFAEAEWRMDHIRWNFIDEHMFFEDFSSDWILGYLNKLLITRRWDSLRKDTGEAKFRDLIQAVKGDAYF